MKKKEKVNRNSLLKYETKTRFSRKRDMWVTSFAQVDGQIAPHIEGFGQDAEESEANFFWELSNYLAETAAERNMPY